MLAVDMQEINPMHGQTCGAKTRDGDPCKNAPVTGSKRCRMHGGKTPSGVASVHFKHGRYSKNLPTHLADDYEEALLDPNTLDLYDEIALTTAHINYLLAQASAGVEVSWSTIQEAQDLRRRLVATQSRYLLDHNQIITAARVYIMVSAIQDIILRNVQDQATRAAIAHELRTILSRTVPTQDDEHNNEEANDDE